MPGYRYDPGFIRHDDVLTLSGDSKSYFLQGLNCLKVIDS